MELQNTFELKLLLGLHVSNENMYNWKL